MKIAREQRIWRWAWLGPVGLMCVPLVFGLRQHPSSFDDAYITYRYARNIALGRGFVYNLGEPVLGTTTPLYTLLLAGLSLLWDDIPTLSHYIGVSAWMLCVPIIYGIGQIEGRKTAGIIAAVLIAFTALFLRTLGMETALYVLLVLLTFYLYLKGRSNWAAVCAGLTFLTRWDGILVVGVFLFAQMLKDKKAFLRAGVLCALIIVPWLGYSSLTFGSIFPNTFFAKLGQGLNKGLGGAEIGPFGRGLLRTAVSAYTTNRLFVLFPALWLAGLFSVFRHKVKWWPILLWTATYAGGYLALGVLSFGWYYLPIVPALALLTAEGAEVLARSASVHLKWSMAPWMLIGVLCALCLVPNIDWLVSSQRTTMDAHSTTYTEVGRWLQAHTPLGSSVALLEIGIIGYYSDRPVVDTMGLVSPGMLRHLGDWFQTLRFAINNYWPAYAVALNHTAWMVVVREPWFEEAYILEAQIENSADPVAPVKIYRRRNGFPLQKFALDSSPYLSFDQAFVLRQIQVAEEHIHQKDRLHVQLTWEAQADITIDYRFQFDLLNVTDGRRWVLGSGLQPMYGGNPTTQWHQGDRIVDTYSLQVPADMSAGTYLLQLNATGKDGPSFISDLANNPIGYVVTGPIMIGEGLATARKPTYPVTVTFADHISLVGYDLNESATDNNLVVTLHWKATDSVSSDYTVFVHLLSSEGELMAQHDSPPRLPTGLWIPGIQVSDVHTLTLPAGLPLAADWQIRVGLYHWPDLERLSVIAPGGLDEIDNALVLGYISLDD